MFPTLGSPAASLVIIVDAPFSADVQNRRLLSAPFHKPVPLALHRAGISLQETFTISVLSSPLKVSHENRSLFYEEHLTTVKKHGEEQGFVPVEGGFASHYLCERREELLATLDAIGPVAVLCLGDIALWALTGQWGSLRWRGSILPSVKSPAGKEYKCVAGLSTYFLNLAPEWKEFFYRDVERAVNEAQTYSTFSWPKWNFLLQASFEEYEKALWNLETYLDSHVTYLSCDIETIRRQIACISLAWTHLDALCIPLRTSKEYWTIEQELALIQALKRVLEHPNARIIGQNFHYDAQYICTKWGIIPRCTDDTMILSHIISVNRPKSLDKIASLHCDFYAYWKDELDDYKSAPKDDNKFFSYNCRDACYTFESFFKSRDILQKIPGHYSRYRSRMDRLWWTILRMTLRGIRVNALERGKLAEELMDASQQRQDFLDFVIGRPFNPRSTPQMKEFFYGEMGVVPEKGRTTKKPSLNAENLLKVPEQRPLLAPIVDAIVEMRSLGVYLKTFALAPLDHDQRIRSFFAMAGTNSFRLSSSENAFGTGANLQNIPTGDRARTPLKMPNIRAFFLPDYNKELFDIDLAGADAQVVAWEADDALLKELFRKGIKVHAVNAKDLFGGDAGPDGKKEPYYTRTKTGVHLTNYGGRAPTMAKALGITIHESELFQRRWFDIHPGIKEWHKRVESDLHATRRIYNKFGYYIEFLGRLENAFNEALAWGPQSTVALITAQAMDILDLEFPEVELLIQVHDSLLFQIPIRRDPTLLDRILSSTRITVPYDDPLIIPFGVKSSTKNWGECK